MSTEPVWILDDDSSIRWVLQKALMTAKIECASFEKPHDLLLQLDSGHTPQVIISDIKMPGMDGITLLDEVHAKYPELPIIIMTAHSDLDSAVNAYQHGAYEYLPKPFDITDAVALTERALLHAKEQNSKTPNEAPQIAAEIIGAAPAIWRPRAAARSGLCRRGDDGLIQPGVCDVSWSDHRRDSRNSCQGFGGAKGDVRAENDLGRVDWHHEPD